MKKIISLFLVLSILWGTVSTINVVAINKKENDKIRNFIDDSIKLINQAPDILEEKVANNDAIKSEEDFDTYSEFETCRLIVKSEEKPDKLNSLGIASGFEDYHIVQFMNEHDAEVALDYYSEQDGIISVYPDEIISLADFEAEEITVSKQMKVPERLNSWGADAIGLYDLKDYLINKNIQMNESVIGVVDSGVDLDHEFLQGRLIETGFNTTNSGIENSEMDKVRGHGTKVSSVIVDSTSENVKVAVYKIFNDDGISSSTEVTLGILQAVEDNVDIINASFSVVDREGIVSNAIKYAYSNNVVVVTSSGNWSNYLDTTHNYPAKSTYSITVASVGELCMPSSFTNYGKCVDISAPGEDIPVAHINNSYTEDEGTSFSAPYVASVCAILKSLNPDYTVDDIKDKIKDTATSYDEIVAVHENINELYGVGIIDALDVLDYKRQSDIEVNIKPGDYYEPISIELSSEGSEEIYYTLDQTTPTKANGILYTEPIEIVDDCFVVRAIAYGKDGFRSEVFSGYYKSWQEESEENFIVDETGKILLYSGDSSQLFIPETVNGITVTDIANGVFDDSQVFSVMLPKTITRLTGGFFENKNVAYVYGESVKEIGNQVFRRSNLSYVYLPNVEKVGRYAFGTTFNLIGISLPKLKIADKYAFYNSKMLYMFLPELETAGESCFYYSFHLVELYVPKLKTIGDSSIQTGSKWFQDSLIFMPLDLPVVEKSYEKDLISRDERYIKRIEFSNLKELCGLPTSTISEANFIMVLPATVEKITTGIHHVNKGSYTIYGSKDTLVEQWAKDNGFEFIEITHETAVITDLPEYSKSYMGELEADVVGFNREYQWYANTVDSNEGGTPIEGATNKKFNPADYPAPYYYCEVTSTDKGYEPMIIKTYACENRSVEFADYSSLEEVLTKIPADLSIYTAETRGNLESLIAESENLDGLNQKQIDELAVEIEKAISKLELITVTLSQSEITLRYKETYSISATSESNVTWVSTNSDVATVDQNGNITAISRGTTEIISEIKNGEKDICTVTVKFTWWQWLIRIFLFGWIWY